ncbi:glycoside hydrolase family 16 protein [Moniliophthora roreri MCA 2997]|uniref:Glycoside hydrolase family 16 protein n=1 Tax=Moniliophthora roreri (strain MCA 2997) TaxID=1381753 RepID=V2XQB6_MONRO|nr:glycoside hydrolase family 16 protein [Moniliophthora roreri MCA 2997]
MFSHRDYHPIPSTYQPSPPWRDNAHSESRYSAGTESQLITSISERYSFPPNPQQWPFNVSPHVPEPDDDMHDPDTKNGKFVDAVESSFSSSRGWKNYGCLLILLAALLMLFVGYPILTYVKRPESQRAGYNLGGINASGQIPDLGNFGLIDLDTPQEAYTKKSLRGGSEWSLVFSDEFSKDGRTFYPGDDPYWEAVDLHYWGTNNMEWYSPEAITTQGGSLVFTFSEKQNHGLNYQGGMMTTWNKFCFTGGLIEASVQLPDANNISLLLYRWPAIWTLGNLGRAGYGATLDGLWPYSYDTCDVGTAPNQTVNGLPVAATIDGLEDANYALSYLPGQRLSRCTCRSSEHPGPVHSDGTFVGRGAPEIDMFEAQVSDQVGEVSQSAQWAPFNDKYVWKNTSDNLIINDATISKLNTYIGGKTQQATSVATQTNQGCYELSPDPCFSVYGFEYKPGFDNAYISWMSDNKQAWTINAGGLAADDAVQISARPIPQEPMYIIMNLGMSKSFGEVDINHLTFPNHMRVDWIRVYQDPKKINVGCDPKDFPTQAYIQKHMEAYQNPNKTTWVDDYKQPWPKNSLIDTC